MGRHGPAPPAGRWPPESFSGQAWRLWARDRAEPAGGVNLWLMARELVDGKGQAEILLHRQGRQQVEVLIDDAKVAAAQAGPLVHRQGVEAGLPSQTSPRRGQQARDEG